MRLVTLDDGCLGRPGAVLPDGRMVDLGLASGGLGVDPLPTSVRAILADSARHFAPIRAALAAASGDGSARLRALGAIRPADSALLAPIPDPRLIVSTSGNFRSHMAEMKSPAPKEPGGFVKSSSAVVGSGHPIRLPAKHGDMVDWEGEFAFVFGRACHNISAEEAVDYVAGYTLFNDVSARDWTSGLHGAADPRSAVHAFNRNVFGKQFPTFAPLGPAILTCDELPDPAKLILRTRVNGDVMQSTEVGDTVFSFGEIIAHFARWFHFLPGDIITTGTPAGVGVARDPKIFLKPGDVVDVEVEEIGVLRSPVEAAAA